MRPTSWWLWSVVVVLLVGSGCSGKKVTTKISPQLSRYPIRTIAVLPFDTLATPQAIEGAGPSFPVPSGARRAQMSVAVSPPSGQVVRRTHLIPPEAGEKITELMWVKLKDRAGLWVLSPQSAAAAAKTLAGTGSVDEVSAEKIAEQLGADAVLSGRVLVYQERVGGRFGADPPAAVGFEVTLVAPDGAVLWDGNYYEKQRPLIEDVVGFVKRYGMFVTADELAAYGASELADAFPVGGAVE